MTRNCTRRADLIREADELLDAAREHAREANAAGALRAIAAAGDCYHRAGMGAMVEELEAVVARALECGGKFTRAEGRR